MSNSTAADLAGNILGNLLDVDGLSQEQQYDVIAAFLKATDDCGLDFSSWDMTQGDVDSTNMLIKLGLAQVMDGRVKIAYLDYRGK